jgi:hypothetical protein
VEKKKDPQTGIHCLFMPRYPRFQFFRGKKAPSSGFKTRAVLFLMFEKRNRAENAQHFIYARFLTFPAAVSFLKLCPNLPHFRDNRIIVTTYCIISFSISSV